MSRSQQWPVTSGQDTDPRGPAEGRARGYRRSGLAPRGSAFASDSRVSLRRHHQTDPSVRHLREVQSQTQAPLRGPVEPGQYVSLAFGRAAHDAGIAVSMGSRGDAYDNAVAETFFATLKRELVNRRT